MDPYDNAPSPPLPEQASAAGEAPVAPAAAQTVAAKLPADEAAPPPSETSDTLQSPAASPPPMVRAQLPPAVAAPVSLASKPPRPSPSPPRAKPPLPPEKINNAAQTKPPRSIAVARPQSADKPYRAAMARIPENGPFRQAAEVGAAQGNNGPSQMSAASYGALLSAEIARHKIYPEGARHAGVTGTVGVALMVGPSGRIVSHAITQSSGNAELDGAVHAMMAAVQAPPPPGGSFRTHVNIPFELH